MTTHLDNLVLSYGVEPLLFVLDINDIVSGKLNEFSRVGITTFFSVPNHLCGYPSSDAMVTGDDDVMVTGDDDVTEYMLLRWTELGWKKEYKTSDVRYLAYITTLRISTWF